MIITTSNNSEVQNLSKQKTNQWYDPLEEPGIIAKAKKHANANRPMEILKPITADVDFCQCCLLPVETPSIVQPYSFCTSISSYSNLGAGTKLYFYLMLFCIFINFLFILLVSAPEVYHSQTLVSELITYCNGSDYNETVYNESCSTYANITNKFFSNENWLFIYNYNAQSQHIKLYKLLHGTLPQIQINYCILSLIFIGLLYLINVIFLMMMKNNAYEQKMSISSPSDYSVFVDNLDTLMLDFEKYKEIIGNDKMQKSDKELFPKFIMEDLLQIEDSENVVAMVNYCYKINYFFTLQKAENDLQKKLYQVENIQWQKDMNRKYGLSDEKNNVSFFEGCCCCYTKIKKKKLIKAIKNAQDQMEDQKDKLTNNFANCLYISFKTIGDKKKFYCQYPNTKWRLIKIYTSLMCVSCCKACYSERTRRLINLKSTIDVSSAPEVDDIIWENLEYTKRQRLCLRLKTTVYSLILIAISLGTVCLLNFIQDKSNAKFTSAPATNTSTTDGLSNDTKKTIANYLISFSVSITITLINFLIQLLLEKITEIEKKRTKTEYYLSFSIKLTFTTFFNTAIVPYIGYLLWKRTILEELTRSIFMIFITNSFLTPCLWLFNIQFFLKKIMICFVERRYKKLDNTKEFPYTQRELNALYEKPAMLISFKFSFFAMTSLMTAFYATLLPIGVVISILGLIFAFYVEKWNIAHIYKRPEMLNDKLPMFYFNYFRYLIILFGLGNVLFIESFFISSNIWRNIYWFVLLGILLFPASTVFNFKCITQSKSLTKLADFFVEYLQFTNDYQRQNPITKKEGNVFYLEQLKKNHMITDEEYKNLLKEINNVNLLEMYYRSKNNIRNLERRNSMIKQSQLNVKVNVNDMIDNGQDIVIEPLKGNVYLKEIKEVNEMIHMDTECLGPVYKTISFTGQKGNIEEIQLTEGVNDIVLTNERHASKKINQFVYMNRNSNNHPKQHDYYTNDEHLTINDNGNPAPLTISKNAP